MLNSGAVDRILLVGVLCPVTWCARTTSLDTTRDDFRKIKVAEQKMSLVSLQLLSEIFLILGRNERDMIKNVYWYSCKVCTGHIVENYSIIKFHENPYSDSSVP
jgi:hypothetical protein